MFTFAKTTDLLGNRRSCVSVNGWSSRRSSDLVTVLGIVGGFHAANIAKRTFASECLVSCGGGGGQAEIFVDHCRKIPPGLGSKLFHMNQRFLAGSASFLWHTFQIIMIKNMLFDQSQISVTDSPELRPIKLSGTNPANSHHYV